MRLTRPMLMLLRVLAATLVVLGVAFWTGHWYGLVSLHRMLGVLFVLTFWGIAVLNRGSAGLVVLAVAWGLLLAGVGFSQARILPGDLHWIVRVLHLAIAVAAMPIAERLARTTTAVREQVARAA